MTFEKMLNDVSFDKMSIKDVYDEVVQKDNMKRINYYVRMENISKEPLKQSQLQELNAIVGILQILYTSGVGSPISDTDYDTLQEMLIDLGVPRLTGSVEINSASKISHKYTTLRGTLDKVYYLFPDEPRTNKSRKSLDEWIKSAEAKYFQATGEKINLNNCKILLQNKFDGASCVLESGDKAVWLTRGDTKNNKASDVSHIMNIFNDVYATKKDIGIKFEVMMTEENKDRINELYRDANRYNNSRQVVTSILNSNEADFKAEYLYPVPLRIIESGDDVEQIHPELIEKFPTEICTFADRDQIKAFANKYKYVTHNGMRFRTDGAVLTILDPKVQKALGRDGNINNFEVAYKFTEESAYTRVKRVEFYVSEFGFITPVLVVNDVILKGNTINHISLSNYERFSELDLSYGDEVKVLYDIIPYVIIDENCHRVINGRKIEFTKKCPTCNEALELTKPVVQCKNPDCSSKVVGRIMNYCAKLRIQNIGLQTLDSLWKCGLLEHGIRSLYKLRKKSYEIEELDGFGRLKTRKIISEIEAKRRLKDYEFFGAIGIEKISTETFKAIFANIPLSQFLDMLSMKNFDLMYAKLIDTNGVGDTTAKTLIEYLKDVKQRVELEKLLKEVNLRETYGDTALKGKIVFSGCRPTDDTILFLNANGWDASDVWNNRAKCLVIPTSGYTSSKVKKAQSAGVKIISLDGNDQIAVLKKEIK